MPELIVRVEAVNFAATILDTNDLSTIRGGGLAALGLAKPVEEALRGAEFAPKCVYAGASQCAFRLATEHDEAAATAIIEDAVRDHMRAARGAGRTAPHAFMMHVVSVAPIKKSANGEDDVEKALGLAEARGHAQQFRQWTELPIAFSNAAEDADPLDGVRPATVPTYFPKGKLLDPDEGEQADRRRFDLVSAAPAVKARIDFGRLARQGFYADILKDRLPAALAGKPPELVFANNFQDIVADPPEEAGQSVQSKIAVVYADGNKFGDARRRIGSTAAFSDRLGDLRAGLLEAAVTWLADGAANPKWGDVFAVEGEVRDRPAKGLRFEPILYGGDEVAFVMPAWLATTFVEGFFRRTAGWTIHDASGQSIRLTHAVGVAIGHVKVPIRQLRAIAKEAADAAKDALKDQERGNVNSATFEIFESLHPPDTEFLRWRQSVYGGRADGDRLARALALPGDEFPAVLQALDRIKHGEIDARAGGYRREPFPRSQLYAALRKLREKGIGVGEDAANQTIDETIGVYTARAGGDRGLSPADLRLPVVPGVERGPALDLALIATLWDYANPFGNDFPRFAAATATSGAPA